VWVEGGGREKGEGGYNNRVLMVVPAYCQASLLTASAGYGGGGGGGGGWGGGLVLLLVPEYRCKTLDYSHCV
jgi:hypothetical protein